MTSLLRVSDRSRGECKAQNSSKLNHGVVITFMLSFHFSHKRSNFMSMLQPQSISLSADIDESRVTICTRTCSGLHFDVTSLNLTSMPGAEFSYSMWVLLSQSLISDSSSDSAPNLRLEVTSLCVQLASLATTSKTHLHTDHHYFGTVLCFPTLLFKFIEVSVLFHIRLRKSIYRVRFSAMFARSNLVASKQSQTSADSKSPAICSQS